MMNLKYHQFVMLLFHYFVVVELLFIIKNYYGANLINKLEPDYVSRIYEEQPPTAGKAPFTLRFNLVSTIFPEDKSITEFLNIYHRSEDEVPDKILVTALKNLQDLS